MDRGTYAVDLFGRGHIGDPLVLPHPLPSRTARMPNDRTASCEGVTVVCDTPIQALCGALVGMGLPDSAVQFVDIHGAAVMFVESLHGSVAVGRRAA